MNALPQTRTLSADSFRIIPLTPRHTEHPREGNAPLHMTRKEKLEWMHLKYGFDAWKWHARTAPETIRPTSVSSARSWNGPRLTKTSFSKRARQGATRSLSAPLKDEASLILGKWVTQSKNTLKIRNSRSDLEALGVCAQNPLPICPYPPFLLTLSFVFITPNDFEQSKSNCFSAFLHRISLQWFDGISTVGNIGPGVDPGSGPVPVFPLTPRRREPIIIHGASNSYEAVDRHGLCARRFLYARTLSGVSPHGGCPGTVRTGLLLIEVLAPAARVVLAGFPTARINANEEACA